MKSITFAFLILFSVAGISFAHDAKNDSAQCPTASGKHHGKHMKRVKGSKDGSCSARSECCSECCENKMTVVYSSRGGSVHSTAVSVR